MNSLLNTSRPALYCPGCSHDRMTKVLDQALQNLGLSGHQIAIVSDIGCNGQFDTFFNTHALHGLHGRALTYATGIKLVQPELNVIVTMGDGGLGIGGAHFNAACRRNLDLTLLVLNNFNFGMTGGQYSVTTPTEANVTTGFLNHLEPSMDVCAMARSSGATFVARTSTYDKELTKVIQTALAHEGFAVLDIWGVCTGRYAKKNNITPRSISSEIDRINYPNGIVAENLRPEYGTRYRAAAAEVLSRTEPSKIFKQFDAPVNKRQEVIILGNAGQRVLTAGELLCYAGMSAGLQVSKKDEYNITVLTGPSISEVILSPEEIDYTGIRNPSVIIAIAQEGVDRRLQLLEFLKPDTLLIYSSDVVIPATSAHTHLIDFKQLKIKNADRALAAIIIMTGIHAAFSVEMIQYALNIRFKGETLKTSKGIVSRLVQ